MTPPVPGAEVADHGHLSGVGRPDGKVGAAHAVNRHEVSSQLLVQLIMRPLVEQVEVLFAQEGHVMAHPGSGFAWAGVTRCGGSFVHKSLVLCRPFSRWCALALDLIFAF